MIPVIDAGGVPVVALRAFDQLQCLVAVRPLLHSGLDPLVALHTERRRLAHQMFPKAASVRIVTGRAFTLGVGRMEDTLTGARVRQNLVTFRANL